MVQTLKEFIEERCVGVDRDMFMMMWNVIDGPEWIRLERTFILSSLVTNSDQSAVNNFYRRVLITYRLNIDYTEVLDVNRAIHGSRAKFYNVTKRTFVNLLCTTKTPLASRYLNFLYDLQLLVVQYYKSQYDDCQAAIAEMMNAPAIITYTRSRAIIELEETLELRNKIGVVYFIHEDGDPQFFKIGYTYDLPSRISTLQTGNRRKLVCYKHVYCKYAKELETYLHGLYDNQKISGEWFQISTDNIDQVCMEL